MGNAFKKPKPPPLPPPPPAFSFVDLLPAPVLTSIAGEESAPYIAVAAVLLPTLLLLLRCLGGGGRGKGASARKPAASGPTADLSGTWLNTSLEGDAALFYTAVGVSKGALTVLQAHEYGVGTITHAISMQANLNAITTAINWPTPVRVTNIIDGVERVATRFDATTGASVGQERYTAYWQKGVLVVERVAGSAYHWRRWLRSDRVMVVELDTGRGVKLCRVFEKQAE